ncbi:threonylcarbamoyl-AMP synthase [Candidatus Microgenomates bacterium]|nr:threonylcarbamoyl-AMP synthase [Candidatus Microgenomates bacterium]
MKLVKLKDVNIQQIVNVLSSGGLVILPTETLYGAMVDATNFKATQKLNEYKKRPLGKPYSIAVTDPVMASKFVHLNSVAKKLYRQFLPGPITIISKGKGKVARGVESEDNTLGIRIPDYKLVIDVIRKLGKPLTATSANASYKKKPYKVEDILKNITEKQKKLIDLIVDVGELPHNEPSTVIDTTLDDPAILRQGDIVLKDKNELLSRSPENTQNIAKELWQKYENFSGKRAIIFALEGKMGTGKTVFVKGLARAMGIDEKVTSPTYDLLNTYGPLTHIDTWRMIKPQQELVSLGTKGLLNDKSVIAIEWADKVEDQIHKYTEDAVVIWVKFVYSSAKSGHINDRVISWGVL